jgi:hypothetical protein
MDLELSFGGRFLTIYLISLKDVGLCPLMWIVTLIATPSLPWETMSQNKPFFIVALL